MLESTSFAALKPLNLINVIYTPPNGMRGIDHAFG